MLRSLIAVTWIGAATFAMADPVPLTDVAIRQQLSAAVLELDTPLGVTIPVRFSSDGLVSGDAGPLASTLGAAKDRGRWWTDHDQLCLRWFRWFDARARCISVQRDGKRIYWQEAGGESGTATIVESGKVAAAPASKPVSEGQKDDPVAAMATPPALSANQLSSPVPKDTSPAPDELPSLRFATAGLSEVVSSSPTEAGALSRLGVGEPPGNETPLPPPPKEKPPAVNPSAPKVHSNEIPLHRAESSEATRFPFRVAGVNVGDTLNVRGGPSEFHAAVGSISPTGRGVRIIGGCRELWCPIRYGRVVGWVNRYYLAEDVESEASER